MLRRKVRDPLLNLLRQGLTPQQLAWSAALGAYLGVIPVLGGTMILCTVVALPLRLNLVAIQAANWLVYPLQILLIIPFFRWGERLFKQPPLNLSPAELFATIRADPWRSLHTLGSTTWHAVVVWLLVGLPVILVLYAVLQRVFTAISRRMPRAHHPGS